MATQQVLDHELNVYLAVTVSPSSATFANPQGLVIDPSITYVGTVGQLPDVQLISVPRNGWNAIKDNLLARLNGLDGVKRVDVEQPPRMRAKRNTEEF